MKHGMTEQRSSVNRLAKKNVRFEQHHRAIARFQRYLTTRANNFNRARRALEDYLAKRVNEVRKEERHEIFKEKSKPEPTIRELLDGMKAKKDESDRLKQQS